MPTGRTPIHRQRTPAPRITNEMGLLYRRAAEIKRAGRADKWEHEGGNRREYIDTAAAVHRMLGRWPWQWSVTDDLPSEPWDDRDSRDLQGAIEAKRLLDRYLPR